MQRPCYVCIMQRGLPQVFWYRYINGIHYLTSSDSHSSSVVLSKYFFPKHNIFACHFQIYIDAYYMLFRRFDCLLNRLFRRRSRKTSKLHVTGLCAGNSPVTGEFPAQRASNAENVSIWWRHHDINVLSGKENPFVCGRIWFDTTTTLHCLSWG